jgi:acetyl-CoA carboxylase carboxyltransferase component
MKPPVADLRDDASRLIPELVDILPDKPNRPYNMHDIIKKIVDAGEYMEYLPLYAGNIITCFAHLDGHSIGIVANQPNTLAGCLDINASDKAARFIRTCDAFGLPLLNMVDVPGFLPGTNQEYGGIIRHGAKMLYAYCEASVPKVTLIMRKAYGGAYLAMCSQDLGADVVLAWPGAEIAVMGPEGAANIIFRTNGQETAATLDDRKKKIEAYRQEFNTPYKAAERGMIDDIIHPAYTRRAIIAALAMLATKTGAKLSKKHGNIPL